MANDKSGLPAKQETAGALATADLLRAFPLLAYPQSELLELMEENLGEGTLPKLQRIPWPTGGALQFEMQTDEGPKMLSELTGIAVHHMTNRLFWQKTFDESGGGEIPDCSSPDGIHGYGKPFDALKTQLMHPQLRADPDYEGPFACSKCPLSKFRGDRENGERPRCRQTHPVFMILMSDNEEDINLLPVIVSIPPSSLALWDTFAGQLYQRGMSYRRAVIQISLTRALGGPGGKIPYSEAVIRRVGALTTDQMMFMKEYAEKLETIFARYTERAVDAVVDEDEDDPSVVEGEHRVVDEEVPQPV